MKSILKVFSIFLIVCAFCILNSSNVLAADQELTTGTYTSNDGHTITINEDSTILYDGTYSLTATASDRGDKLTGKIGTNNKSVTFYQLNSSKLVSGAVVNYTHGGATVYLYDYTVFSLDITPVVEADSGIEVWRNGSKVNSYADLQSAVDAAKSGDTIKITKNLDVVGGAYVAGKTLTIDGGDNTLNSATWSNSVFIVEEGATLKVNNLTIDGGSTGFEVNYDAVTYTNTTIPLKSGSDASDIKQNLSAIITKGNLNTDKMNVNNYYTANGAINVVSGNVIFTNTNFVHNRSTSGGAVYIGSNFKQDQTTYPVGNIYIDNCDFSSNYSTNGGAIYIYNTEGINIENSNFTKNTVTGGNGGAILVERQTASGYGSMAQKLGLEIIPVEIDNCIFDANWVGNDGTAIHVTDGTLYITNSTFKNNVGTHPTSSVGTISYLCYREKVYYNSTIDNSTFEKNKAAVSVIGDHGSFVNIDISNSQFIENEGNVSFLYYSASGTFTNCQFESECASKAVVDLRSRYEESEEGILPMNVVFEDVAFSNTQYKVPDIFVRRHLDSTPKKHVTAALNGDIEAKIDVWAGNDLIINGNYTGVINTDGNTTSENIVINERAIINGEVYYNIDQYTITVIFPYIEKNMDMYIYIYSEAKTFTTKEFFMEHMVSKDVYILEYYTDTAYTTAWDYTVSEDITIYGKWVEHTHTYETFIVHENAIYEQCSCGYLGRSLSLEKPQKLVYTGEAIPEVVNNELGIAEENYTITYQIMNSGAWEERTEEPLGLGKYKAILTHGDLTIEEEYTITNKSDNPNTGDNIIISIVIAVISLCTIGLIVNHRKNK